LRFGTLRPTSEVTTGNTLCAIGSTVLDLPLDYIHGSLLKRGDSTARQDTPRRTPRDTCRGQSPFSIKCQPDGFASHPRPVVSVGRDPSRGRRCSGSCRRCSRGSRRIAVPPGRRRTCASRYKLVRPCNAGRLAGRSRRRRRKSERGGGGCHGGPGAWRASQGAGRLAPLRFRRMPGIPHPSDLEPYPMCSPG
jgi:hypothetical protein